MTILKYHDTPSYLSWKFTKEGGAFDLPIALGILAASGQLPTEALDGCEFAGELSLSGELRPVRGALALAREAAAAGRRLLLPAANAGEAALARGLVVLPAASLGQVAAHLCGLAPIAPHPETPLPDDGGRYPDLADVKGQASARRALEVAAAGGHSLLLFGPPGSGKSMLAQRLPGLLPPMEEAAALESAALQSLHGPFDPASWARRPFRSPHHSASMAAIVGGGALPRPGEISLAHEGVLFLDELPEFERRVLEALREPLETGRVHVARAAARAEFPAAFQLVAAMNPCPCGHAGNPSGRCRCSPGEIARYRQRLSGPLLDRVDLVLEVPALRPAELQHAPAGEASDVVRARVAAARARQLARQGCCNARLAGREIERHCMPDEAGASLAGHAIDKLGLSARGYHRLLKVARTVADLAGLERVGAAHVAEAVQSRRGLHESRPDRS